jgi:ABC-type lipoprotein release transport system permease subunit
VIRVSAFLVEFAREISSDLRSHVAPDKLQFEVEMELQKQILSQCVQAIGEYQQAIQFYRSDEVKIAAGRKKVLRFMGYCSEMWVVQDQVKGALTSGEVRDITELDAIFS